MNGLGHAWMISCISTIHIAWALGLLLNPVLVNNSFINEMYVLAWSHHLAVLAWMLFAAVLAVAGLFFQNRSWTFAASVPQQLTLFASAGGFVLYFATSSVPEVEGTIPRAVIWPAMCIAVSLAVFNTLAMVDSASNNALSRVLRLVR